MKTKMSVNTDRNIAVFKYTALRLFKISHKNTGIKYNIMYLKANYAHQIILLMCLT